MAVFRSGLLVLAAIAGADGAAAKDFSIAGAAIAEADIVDARGLPQIDGTPMILVTFEEKAALRLAPVLSGPQAPSTARIGELTLVLPKGAFDPAARTLAITGIARLDDAEKLARLISGKDPLPDDLEE